MRDEDIYRLIGRRLRMRRRLLEMTQTQVALSCGLTFQRIQKYEAGLVAMPFARLVFLAGVLKMPIEALVQGLHDGEAAPRDAAHDDRAGSDGPRRMVA
jgi:transcriptional regulator with XRE-family HTH domain